MKIGIIGLPQSGKTTVLHAASGGASSSSQRGRIARSIVRVQDRRVDKLAEMENSGRIVYAEVEFVDAGGLGSKGKDFSELKNMDALLLVVDGFSGAREPASDIRSAIEEMILSDMAQIEGQIPKLEKLTKMGAASDRVLELEVLRRCQQVLEEERPLIELDLSESDLKSIRGYTFLSQKPLLLVVNIAEDSLGKLSSIQNEHAALIAEGRRELAVICAKVEEELTQMEEDERQEFLDDLGIEHSALELVIQKAYSLLGLIPFFTAGEMESRAWTIRRGTNAQKAAGVIHTDIERGFIRAEVIGYEDYVSSGGPVQAKKLGQMRLEGKEYIVVDGDVINFRFNV